jgi:uncharacterized membrane-anchored protein
VLHVADREDRVLRGTGCLPRIRSSQVAHQLSKRYQDTLTILKKRPKSFQITKKMNRGIDSYQVSDGKLHDYHDCGYDAMDWESLLLLFVLGLPESSISVSEPM